MQKLMRATIGQVVQADVTGTGVWAFGLITDFNDKHITFTDHTTGESVRMIRGEVYKANPTQLALAKGAKIMASEATNSKPVGNAPTKRTDFVEPPQMHQAVKNARAAVSSRLTPEEREARQQRRREERDLDRERRIAAGEPPFKNGKVPSNYVANYARGKSATGTDSFYKPDTVGTLLLGKTLEESYEILSEKSGIEVEDLKLRWHHLNRGMQRMCLGNMLRGILGE